MAENITLRRPKQTYLICILIACFAAAAFFLSPVYGLFFSLFSAVACALLFRLYHPAAAAVAPILSFLIMGVLFGFSFDMLLLSFLPSAAGLTMAFCLRRGENRLSTATSVTVSVLVVFLLCATLSLYNAANAAGASDMFVYLSTLLDGVKDAVVAWEMEWLNEIAKWLEAQDLSYALPTEEAIAALISQIMSLIPALFLATVLCLALALTYVVQLLSLLLESRQLFSEKNAVYGLGPLAAAAYLLVSLITLVYTDFSSPFYLVCINTAWVLAPLFTFGALCRVPQLIAFIRHMSHSNFDFTIWIVLLGLCVISYPSQAFVLLAVWQALHILISALRARKKTDAQ